MTCSTERTNSTRLSDKVLRQLCKVRSSEVVVVVGNPLGHDTSNNRTRE